MTMIASVNILMSAKHGRWLTKKELLGTQGFLTDTKHTFGIPCSSYALREWNARRGIASEPWPSRRAACQQAGNSMHTAVSGLVALFCVTQVMIGQGVFKAKQYVLRRQMAYDGTLDKFSPKASPKASP